MKIHTGAEKEKTKSSRTLQISMGSSFTPRLYKKESEKFHIPLRITNLKFGGNILRIALNLPCPIARNA